MEIVPEKGVNADFLLISLSPGSAGITTMPNSIKCHLGQITMLTIIRIVNDLMDNYKI